MIESLLQKRRNWSLIFLGKVDSMFDKQFYFISTLLEVSKIQQSFYLYWHATLYWDGLKRQQKFALSSLQEAWEICAEIDDVIKLNFNLSD